LKGTVMRFLFRAMSNCCALTVEAQLIRINKYIKTLYFSTLEILNKAIIIGY